MRCCFDASGRWAGLQDFLNLLLMYCTRLFLWRVLALTACGMKTGRHLHASLIGANHSSSSSWNVEGLFCSRIRQKSFFFAPQGGTDACRALCSLLFHSFPHSTSSPALPSLPRLISSLLCTDPSTMKQHFDPHMTDRDRRCLLPPPITVTSVIMTTTAAAFWGSFWGSITLN